MHKRYGIHIVLVALLAPLIWLLVTTDMGSSRGLLVVIGGLVTYALLARALWVAHLKGQVMPNLCGTCGRGMVFIPPGGLKGPDGKASKHRWRCHGCGRLA